MIKHHLTKGTQQVVEGKRQVDWIHLNLGLNIPPISAASYPYLVWDLLKKRAYKDVLLCKYDKKSFAIAEKTDCAVCQFDIFSRDIQTVLFYRYHWLLSVLFRHKKDVFLESITAWIRQIGGKKVLLWGGINSLPELRRLLPGVTIAYAQRHYDYAPEVSHYNHCDVLIAQTPGQVKLAYANTLRMHPFVVTIPNGVETETFTPALPEEKRTLRQQLGINPDHLVAVFPSKVALHKGSRYLERLLEKTDQFFSEITYLVIGGLHHLLPDTHRNSLKKLLQDQERVIWCNGVPREEMPDLLRVADVCLMPATWREGFSMAGLEAMASGLPLIAPSTGCYPEIIQDRVNGLLCREEALFTDVVTALQLCLDDSNLLKSLGKNAREYVTSTLPRDKNIDNFCKFLDDDWEAIDSNM
ncbi:MAG: glycosyltransferase [Candidatus Electrothrix sp. LOE1_4_5]|nr:glycosyltransferase [Candidatus Electrothrix gigas]